MPFSSALPAQVSPYPHRQIKDEPENFLLTLSQIAYSLRLAQILRFYCCRLEHTLTFDTDISYRVVYQTTLTTPGH